MVHVQVDNNTGGVPALPGTETIKRRYVWQLRNVSIGWQSYCHLHTPFSREIYKIIIYVNIQL